MYNKKVDNWIENNKDELISFMKKIIQIPSVTGDEGTIQDYLYEYLNNLGLDVEKVNIPISELEKHPGYVKSSTPYIEYPNLVATLKGSSNNHSLLFNGHVDVIPEGDLENWEYNPWSGEIKKGKMYGRGTSDMKSGVAAFTMAIKAIIESDIKLKGDIIAEYVVDEELTGNGTLACVINGYKADAGICCETSSMHVQPGSIGRIWFEIKIKGKAAGIQKHFEGISGIDLGYIITKIVSEFEDIRVKNITHHLYPDILSSIPCAIGQFESGTYASAFPDSCLLKGSIATVPGENSLNIKNEFIEYIVKRASEEHPWFKKFPPEINFTGYFAEPSEIPVNSPIVKVLSQNYESIMKEPPKITGRQGAADTRHLNTYGNTPTVIFGPGLTEQMHANNEYVILNDYINSIKVLASTILDWCLVDN